MYFLRENSRQIVASGSDWYVADYWNMTERNKWKMHHIETEKFGWPSAWRGPSGWRASPARSWSSRWSPESGHFLHFSGDLVTRQISNICRNARIFSQMRKPLVIYNFAPPSRPTYLFFILTVYPSHTHEQSSIPPSSISQLIHTKRQKMIIEDSF
jgi:hypothetical protein